MPDAGQLAFGPGGLDRAAGRRARAAELLPDGSVLALWQGRVLTSAGMPVWLAADDPALAGMGAPVFLGLDPGGCARFAADLSGVLAIPGTGASGPPFDPAPLAHPGTDPALGLLFGDLRQGMTALDPFDAECTATARALLEWHRTHGFCAACGHPSIVAEAGWQRRCPSCGATHFPRTDPVVIMLVTRGNSVLVGRSPGWPEGMYSLLAGFMEPGETVEAAVRREVAEETGILCGAVSYLASQPWPFPASLMLGCRAEAVSQEITLDPAELEDALWLTREEAAKVAAGHHPHLRPVRKGAIAGVLLHKWLAGQLD
jgi:NAD+ diphosphatase